MDESTIVNIGMMVAVVFFFIGIVVSGLKWREERLVRLREFQGVQLLREKLCRDCAKYDPYVPVKGSQMVEQ